ncbi:MAG: metal-dependent hydrolase [Candidatus Thorarchaeota archaeon]|nr:metal-dependent hydrolase [Candidatus Thorarchaeota archaeon]
MLRKQLIIRLFDVSGVELKMPVTPLHYPFAFLVSKLDRHLLLPGLIVGSVIPDIEVSFMWMFFANRPDHLFMHSLVGALTIGTILALIVTRFLYSPIISSIFKMERDELNRVCRITPWMGISCILGVISHLVLDYPMHWYNPILWPWVNPFDIVGPLVLLFMPTFDVWTAYLIASAIMHTVMIVSWYSIIRIIRSKGNLWYRHWIKDTAVTKHIV